MTSCRRTFAASHDHGRSDLKYSPAQPFAKLSEQIAPYMVV